MKTAVALSSVLILALVLAPFLTAQDKPATQKYNVATESKLRGTIEDVKIVPKSCTGEDGVHLMLRTEKELAEVQIAPDSFLKDLAIKFEKGQKIEVTASKVGAEGAVLYLAREIIVDPTNTIIVRDDKGGPVWNWNKKQPTEAAR